MGTRTASLLLTAVLLAGCSDDDSGITAQAEATTDADCAELIPDHVFTTLGWVGTPEGAEFTVRGCHRESEQGYVEVRERRGYRKLCRTLDHTGGLSPGAPVDWLGEDVTACAVEPAGDVGQTKVAVRQDDHALLITVVAVTATEQARVREAVEQVLAASGTL
jgi:hypothetical protein